MPKTLAQPKKTADAKSAKVQADKDKARAERLRLIAERAKGVQYK